jgi:hypothetical protein
MFRGPLVLATLLEAAQATCPDCAFDVTALEEFSVNIQGVRWAADEDTHEITTQPLSFWTQSADSSMAVNVRNLQLKWNNHGHFAPHLAVGPLPIGGMEFQEEIHINGLTGQASLHIGSPIVNMCFQVDHLPPFAQMERPMINQRLSMAEQAGPGIAQQYARHMNVDGEDVVAFADPSGREPGFAAFTDSTHPKLFAGPLQPDQERFYLMMQPRPSFDELNHMALKADNYVNTVGNQFGVRACEVESHANSQALLAANPTVKDFVASRLAFHQGNMQLLLRPFNKSFTPLEIEDLMVPVGNKCGGDELAQISPKAWNAMQVSALSVCAFVTGIAVTFGISRKKHVTPADEYHLVAA